MEGLLTRRRTREISGPTPHSVAILAKPTLRRPREYLVLERRRQEELRQEATAIVEYNKQFDVKTTWERTTDKMIQQNAMKRRVTGLLQQQRLSLEERRDRLKDLLQREQEALMNEVTTKLETPLERQARMRERARSLKEKREMERKILVEEKLNQRWRNQCEELRAIAQKRNQDQVSRERAEQLRVKAEQLRQQQEEEVMYACLWEEDRLSKCKREEMETVMQTERNKEALKVLNLQTAAIEKQRLQMKQLKEEEAKLRLEETSMRALEDQRAREEKHRMQEQTKADLDFSLRLKMKRKAKQAQEEVAMDMKLLEQMLQASSNEAHEQQQRKKELREEMSKYLAYLAEQQKEEMKRAAELDAMVTAEVNKQWEKRSEQWRREKAARKKLMEDVIKGRKEQIQLKLSCIEEEKKVMEKEAERIQASIRKHHELEEQQRKVVKQANLMLQRHQLQQIDFQHQLKEAEKAQIKQEIALNEEAERLHADRVAAALTNPQLMKVHPKRMQAYRLQNC